MVAEVYETKPQGFKAAVEIAGCYLEIDGQLLLLEYSSSKTESGKWGVPAGKKSISLIRFQYLTPMNGHSTIQTMLTLSYAREWI